MGDNAALTGAKRAKKDEFYTQRVDIENELRHYKAHFKDKVVLCNCDDPRQSEFFKYFAENFEQGIDNSISSAIHQTYAAQR